MAKEIESIERVTSPGDLPSRLEAAEIATVDVEKKLAKTVSILNLTGEAGVLSDSSRFRVSERAPTRARRGVGTMREEAKRRRSLGGGNVARARRTAERQEAAPRQTRR